METLFIGKKIIRLKRVDSTNNYAARLLRQSGRNEENPGDEKLSEKNNQEPGDKIYEGTIILADFQEKGKGQRGNVWESEEGKNLTFTIILKPLFLKAGQQFLLNKIVSLAICDFFSSLKIENIYIKWPNDIIANGKKIAGILIENTINSNKIIYSAIGIGLNVNQDKFSSALKATSLKIISEKNYSPDNCLDSLSSHLEARYLKLKSEINSADRDYVNSLYGLNEWKNYLVKGKKIISSLTGVTSEGFLVLEQENGNEIFCDFKEVVFL